MLMQINITPLPDPDLAGNILDSVLKTGFVLGAILYLIFSILVIRQIKVMRETLITDVSPMIKTLGLVHFFVATGVMVLFILFL